MAINGEKKIKPDQQKKANKWIRIRQVVQYSVFTIFLGLTAATLFGILLPAPINIFSRLNPLQALTSMIGSREVITNFWLVLITIGVTLVFGRVWCGWFCPLGAGLELYGKKGRRFKWQNLRKFKYVILGVVIVMAAFGSLAFMYFEPITIFVRGITTIFKPLLTYIQLAEKKDFIWPAATRWFIAIPFVMVLLLNLVEKRFWCRYLCPLGALVGFLSKFSWIKRRIDKFNCVQSGECTSTCTMGAISPEKDFESDPAECIMCMHCAKSFPNLTTTFVKGKMGGWNFEFDPGRREVIEIIGLGAVAVGMLGFDVGNVKAAKGTVLRPPGVQGDDFLSKCIRCGQCIEVCPTHALQPAALEAGWDSLFTPVLDPFSGGCAFDCNRCGQVCPSGAIPPLCIDGKRKSVIGKAEFNQQKCNGCMICKDVCPYPGAIIETRYEHNGVTIKSPQFDNYHCVGCGICVFECPEPGAIVVKPEEMLFCIKDDT
jgi:polyferredoxin